MSDEQRLEQKIDKQNDKLDKLVETMTTFIAFQARSEERHTTSNDRLEKVEDRLDTLWDMVHKNSLILNAAWGFACLIVGGLVTWVLNG